MSRTLFPILALLVGAFAAPARADDDTTEIIQFIASTGADPDGTCVARWRDHGDSLDFKIEIEDMDTGDYELWVAGVQVHDGTLTAGSSGEAEVEYETPQSNPKPLFDFEVIDQVIEVRQGKTVFFSDTFDGTGGDTGGGGGDTTKTEVFMVNAGPDLNAKGKLKYEAKPDKVKFSVEVEHLDAGTYDLYVAGNPVSQLVVTGEGEEEIEFQDPVEPGKVLLNFTPLGSEVAVRNLGVTYLSAILPASDTATGDKAPKTAKKWADDTGKKKGDGLLVQLSNVGFVAGAQGTAALTQSDDETEFQVEFEGVPNGDYELEVRNIVVGTINLPGTGGEFKFSTSPGEGEDLLDFPVQGEPIEVTDGTDTLLAVIFPISVQAALGKFKKEIHEADHVKLNLVPTGLDIDARGTLDFKDKESHDTLVITVYDLDPGNYDVVVDGTVHEDALVVTKPDGKAKVTFDSDPKANELALDFPVAGATVQVTPADDADTVLLEAVVE